MFFNFIPGSFWMFCFFTWLFNTSFSCKPCVMKFLVIYGCSPALAWCVSSLHCTRVMFLILSSTHFDGGDDDVGASSFEVTKFWIRFTMIEYIKVDKLPGSTFSSTWRLVGNSKSVHLFFYHSKFSIMKMLWALSLRLPCVSTDVHLPAYPIVLVCCKLVIKMSLYSNNQSSTRLYKKRQLSGPSNCVVKRDLLEFMTLLYLISFSSRFLPQTSQKGIERTTLEE